MTGPLKKGDRVAQVPSGRLGTVDADAADGATVLVEWDDKLGPYRCAPRTLVRAEDAKPWEESRETFVSTAKKDASRRAERGKSWKG